MAKEGSKKRKFSGMLNEKKPEGSWKKTGISTLKDVLCTVALGGVAGAIIGRHAFVTGLVTTVFGHYQGHPNVARVGVGMMASNGFQFGENGKNQIETSGMDVDTEIENVKTRLGNFWDSSKQKIYVDKVFKDNDGQLPEDQGTQGVNYFLHGPDNEVDMSALDQVEQEMVASAASFRSKEEDVPPNVDVFLDETANY